MAVGDPDPAQDAEHGNDLPGEPRPQDDFVLDAADDADAPSPDGGDGAAASLRDLILYLATNLVEDPDTVEVTVARRGGIVDLRLTVPEEELGRIIGRQGRIARALRTSLMVAASRHHLRVSLDIEPT